MKQNHNTTGFSLSNTDEHAVSLNTQVGLVRVQVSEGAYEPFDLARVRRVFQWASDPYQALVDVEQMIVEARKNFFDGMEPTHISDALILGATAFIEQDPAYGNVAARLLRKKLYREVTNASLREETLEHKYIAHFVDGIKRGVAHGVFDERFLLFDLEELGLRLVPSRDDLIDYMGMRTLYERYFARVKSAHIELPQMFWMRVAMGVSLNEPERNERAAEFYDLISQLYYVPSTPTLLHSGWVRAQLSSCFLTTISDDLHHIFKCLGDNAQLSKWSGGVANDWTNVRATGASIDSIKTESQGTIPFLKINSDVTASINRSGKRRAATAVYMENWHYDIEDFLDLRRNTGDDRRRAHDISTATWVPDLFMKRVEADGQWTLFSPHEVRDLHDLYGAAFEKRYEEYEQMAARGEIEQYKTVAAKQLWRKMLSRLFETGHPWVTFKDACNIRSPQDHDGVIHSSNLCTEVTLNTSEDETAVCNLGSVNLASHIVDGKLNTAQLERTIHTAMRMLDNVIDITYYPTQEAKNANQRHRPVGLGLMGFQDALYKVGINFEDEQARTFADETMERISYYAIFSSSSLARERGAYSSYEGSKWDRGLMPCDTIDALEQERGVPVEVNRKTTLDWEPVREHIRRYGMRNSNTMAIAPTATISNIAGCFPCIEPIYKNLYVKANMSGEFTVINKHLVADLKKHGIWDTEMLDQLKYYDGSVQLIDRIPAELKKRYKEAFELDPIWLVHITAARMKWVDQSQSHNVFLRGTSGKMLHEIYMAGWKAGLKTFYYLRSLGATQIEKSTLDAKKFGFTQKREYAAVNGNGASEEESAVLEKDKKTVCELMNGPDCDACQ